MAYFEHRRPLSCPSIFYLFLLFPFLFFSRLSNQCLLNFLDFSLHELLLRLSVKCSVEALMLILDDSDGGDDSICLSI